MRLYVKSLIGSMLIVAVLGDWFFPDALQFNVSEVLNKQCGDSPYTAHSKPEDGRMFENPWLTLFRHPEEADGFCHGTLLTDRHVLTTAICSETIVVNETIVVLGDYDLATKIDCDSYGNCGNPVTERIAGQLVVHPDFKDNSYQNDIALVTLNKNVKLSNSIQPICLPLTPIIPSRIHEPIAYNTLWLFEAARPKQIAMKYVPHATCEKFTKNQLTLHEGQICAKYRYPVATRLVAGSGSPLLVEHFDLTFQLGILSIGLPNATYIEPYVYVNISTHVKWIHDTILSDMKK